MSLREQAQQQVVEYLHTTSVRWTAPYGVTEGMQNIGKGKVRTITFGVARLLDAEVKIWSPTKLVIEADGPLARKVAGTFGSAKALIDHLEAASKEWGE